MTRARYLLDTNIASYVIKGNAPAVDRRLVKVPMEDVFPSGRCQQAQAECTAYHADRRETYRGGPPNPSDVVPHLKFGQGSLARRMMETVMKPIQKIIRRTVSGSPRSRRRLLRGGTFGG